MRKRLWLLAGVVLLIGAFTVTGATAKSAKISGAAAKTTLVYGAEQDVNGFNTNLEASNQFWGVVIGNSAVIRGAYMIDNKLHYIPDLIKNAKVTASPFTITYNIRKNANWSDGVPVSAADFVWSWQRIVDPKDEVAGRDGYDQITRFKISNKNKTVKFFFKTPYADWKDLFSVGVVMPKHVLQSEDYNKVWPDCVCNPKNGKPISDGPFLLQSYRKGTDATLVANPKWYGKKPKLQKIIFRFIQDTNSEIQAMRGGEVDASSRHRRPRLRRFSVRAGSTTRPALGSTWSTSTWQVRASTIR